MKAAWYRWNIDRMRRLLTSDQHTKLQVLFAEHQRSRRGRAKPSPGA